MFVALQRRLRRRQARLAGDQSSSEVNLIADEG